MSVYDSLAEVPLRDGKLTEKLPLGPEGVVRHGKLSNGMTYYVRPCAKPKDRVALGLAVNIGSVVEEDDEQGVAHLVEHLAFNATQSFSSHEIVRFLESIGAQFGACQNAHTSADETVYQLVMPSADWALVERALSVMAEFAFKIRCAQSDINKERGAVLEEWRMGRDSAGRMQEAHWKLILQGSKYAERLPIGKESVIRTVQEATVRRFYKKWYRPENMAIVVSGDFPVPVDDVITAITRHMEAASSTATAPQPTPTGVSPLPPAAGTSGSSSVDGPAAPVPTYGYEPHAVPRYKVFVDKEAQDAMVYASFKHPARGVSTPAEYLDHLKGQLFQLALGARLFRLSRREDPPFFMAQASDETLCKSVESAVLTAVCVEGRALDALEAVLTEVARVRKHGFSDRELSLVKSEMIAEIESTFVERDQGYCTDHRDELVRHFLSGEFVTGSEFEARLSKTLLPLISKADVESVAARYEPSCSCVIKTVEHRAHHSEDDIRAVVQRVQQAETEGTIPPWEEEDIPESLMAVPPQPGTITSHTHHAALGATELTLGNGMRVTFKQTDFMDDEIMVTGVAHGGLSEVPQSHFWTCSLSNVVAAQLGAYGFKPEVLGDVLAGKRVELDFAEGAYSRTFRGNQSPTDLEIAMQLIHLLFTTNVALVQSELATVMKMVHQSIEAQLRNPAYYYGNRVRQIVYGGCYYFEPLSHEALDKVDPVAATEHHNRNYRNPAEFTVVFTGKIDRDQFLPLVERYLGSIPPHSEPSPRPPSGITPLPVSFPEQPVVEDVHVAMVSPITQITLPVELDRPTSRELLVWLGLACRLLESKLLDTLRFQYGEIYTVMVSPFFGCEAPSNTGNPRGDVSISFTCDPANKDKLIELALAEIERLQADGPTVEELSTLSTLERLQFENNQQENSYWHELMVSGYLSKTYQQVHDLDDVYLKNMEARKKVMSELTPDNMRARMRQLLPYPCRSRYTAITMMPEKPNLLQTLAFKLSMMDRSNLYWLAGGAVAAAGVLSYAGYRYFSRTSSSS